MGFKESTKAQIYEKMYPSTGISEAQAAERFDRKKALIKYGSDTKKRQLQDSVIIGGNCWCNCGLFKNHSGDCKK